MSMSTRLGAVLAILALSAACNDERPASLVADTIGAASAYAPALADAANQAKLSVAAAARRGRTEQTRATAGRSVPPTASPAPAPQAGPSSMIIRNGMVSVEVDSVEIAMDAVRRLATALGGYIGNVSIATGTYQVRSGSLEMKIPSARFDDAMAGMAPLGKVEHSSSTAEDVGEEFVDVTARVANAKRLEQRLVSLLATRTGKLEDVLAVERELARVREEIERYEGRIRYLGSRVATSTIAVTVHEKAPIVASQPGTNPLRIAFVNMWRNFVHFVATAIELLGIAIPVAAMLAVALIGWRRWRRPRVPLPTA
jgi:hypothetical protein